MGGKGENWYDNKTARENKYQWKAVEKQIPASSEKLSTVKQSPVSAKIAEKGKPCIREKLSREKLKEKILKPVFSCWLYIAFFNWISEGTWNFSEPKAVGLGKSPVMAMAVVRENLWCSCGNKLYIINHDEEVTKVVSLLENSFRSLLKQLVNYRPTSLFVITPLKIASTAVCTKNIVMSTVCKHLD